MKSPMLCVLLMSAALSSPALAQQAAPANPDGASQLSEVYGDWTIGCGTTDTGRECAMSQSLIDTETRQHVLTLELYAAENGSLEGMLVVPFGLNFAKGVSLSVDEAALGMPLPFLTCLPTGCLVPVVFDASQTSQLRAGTKLAVTGTSAGGEDVVPMTISLNGFTGASQRMPELSN